MAMSQVLQLVSSPDSVNMACVASSELMPKLPRCALQSQLHCQAGVQPGQVCITRGQWVHPCGEAMCRRS